MAGPSRTNDYELIKVAHAPDQGQAEFLQGLLRDADVNSVLRRSPGFDVPEFLASGPRDVLVAASDVAVARDVLREVDPGEPSPSLDSGGDQSSLMHPSDSRTRVLAGVMIIAAVALVIVCLATDVIV